MNADQPMSAAQHRQMFEDMISSDPEYAPSVGFHIEEVDMGERLIAGVAALNPSNPPYLRLNSRFMTAETRAFAIAWAQRTIARGRLFWWLLVDELDEVS